MTNDIDLYSLSLSLSLCLSLSVCPYNTYPTLLKKKKIVSRHWIIPAAAPRVARQHALQSQPRTFYRTIFLDGLNAVIRAGRRVTASPPYPWGECHLIQLDQPYQEFRDQ